LVFTLIFALTKKSEAAASIKLFVLITPDVALGKPRCAP
jgi:hypothetical protein